MKYSTFLLVTLLLISLIPYSGTHDAIIGNNLPLHTESITSRMNSTVSFLNLGTGNSSYSKGLWNLTNNSVGKFPPANTSVTISSSATGKTGTFIFKPGSNISSPGTVGMKEPLANLTGWTSPDDFNYLINGGNWIFNFYLNLSASPTGGTGYAGVAAYLYNSSSGNADRFLLSQNNTNIFSLSPGIYDFVNISTSINSINGTGEYLIIEPFVNVTSVPTLISPLTTTTSLSSMNIFFGIGSREGRGSNLSYPFYGNLKGTVSPQSSLVSVDGVPVSTHLGTFNRSFFPGNYTVSVSTPYYSDFTDRITIKSGNIFSVNVVLKKLYNLSVSVSGLAPDMTWNLSINGTNYSQSNSTFTREVTNGSYSLKVPVFINASKWIRYFSKNNTHTLNVSGGNANYNFAYQKEYYLNLSDNSNSRGTVSPSSGWYKSGSTVNISEISNTGYVFKLWTGFGNGSYSGPNDTETITMNSAINETAWFYPKGVSLYEIYFEESGLPADTPWTVSLNNTVAQTNTTQIYFTVPNGTYGYHIANTLGFEPDKSYGNATVNGNSTIINILFKIPQFRIEFIASGLPGSKLPWTMSVENFTMSSRNSTIMIYLENGSYNFSVFNNSGYTPSPEYGSFTVNGSNKTEFITFNLVLYNITFINSNYNSKIFWGITIYNGTGCSTFEANNADSLTIKLPAGTYNYSAFESGNLRTQNATLVVPQVHKEAIYISFKTSTNSTFSPYEVFQYPFILVFPFLAAIILAAAYMMRRRYAISWDEQFIIYHDGRLLKHYTRRMNPDVDQDLLSASLMAIQNAIKDAAGTKRLDYLNINGAGINIINGKYISVALIGKKKMNRKANMRIRNAIKKIEAENRVALSKWKGDQESVKWLDKYRGTLLP